MAWANKLYQDQNGVGAEWFINSSKLNRVLPRITFCCTFIFIAVPTRRHAVFFADMMCCLHSGRSEQKKRLIKSKQERLYPTLIGDANILTWLNPSGLAHLVCSVDISLLLLNLLLLAALQIQVKVIHLPLYRSLLILLPNG